MTLGLNYLQFICISGIIILSILSIGCYLDMEVLRLNKGRNNESGTALAITVIVNINKA